MAWGGEKPEPGRGDPGAGRGEGRPSRAAGSRVSGKARDPRAPTHSFPLLDPLPLGLSTASEKGKDGPGLRRVVPGHGIRGRVLEAGQRIRCSGCSGLERSPPGEGMQRCSGLQSGVASPLCPGPPRQYRSSGSHTGRCPPCCRGLGGIPVVGRGGGVLVTGGGQGPDSLNVQQS